MRTTVLTVGPLVNADDDGIAQNQTPGAAGNLTLNGALVVNGVAILTVSGQARQVLLTSAGNESGKTVTLYGTDANGAAQSESFAGPNTTATSTLHYQTITRIAVSAAFSGNVKAGTNGVATSRWMKLDAWALPQTAIQCTASGTVNYTVQQTLDDPNSPTNPVSPVNVTWVSHPDSALVGATGTVQGNYAYIPTWMRVLLNSGTGTVTTTVTQSGSVTQ